MVAEPPHVKQLSLCKIGLNNQTHITVSVPISLYEVTFLKTIYKHSSRGTCSNW